MPTRRLPLLFALLLLLPCVGCGDSPDDSGGTTRETGHWHQTTVEGLAGIAGMTIAGDDLLFVPGGGERALYALSRKALDASSPRARAVPIDVRKEALLMGNEPPGGRDYGLGTFWDLEVDFQGLAWQAPEWVFFGDRSHRIIYIGRATQDATGALGRVRVIGAFVAPGAERAGLERGDFRDTGPGLASLLTMPRERRAEDLFLVPRGPGADATGIRVELLDRMGVAMSAFQVRDEGEIGPDIEAASWFEGRFLVWRNSSAGTLMSFREPSQRQRRTATFGRGLPGPPRFEGETYRGMVHAPDGTLYLVTDGDPAHLVWRAP